MTAKPTNPSTPPPMAPPRPRRCPLQWLGALLDFGVGVELLTVVTLVVVTLVFGVDVVMGDDDDPGALADASIRLEAADAGTPDPFVEGGAEVEVPYVNRDEPPGLLDRVPAGLSGQVAHRWA